jgi:signal transduction histidine kinase
MTDCYPSGAAFVDPHGEVLAADPGFLEALGLPEGEVGAALRARAESAPELAALLDGAGPAVIRLQAGEGGKGCEGGHGAGRPTCDVELQRFAGPAGVLLVARAADLQERLEHAQRSAALTRLVPGMAHDIKNPLNAMALQLALLGEKLAGEGEPPARAAAHLAAVKEQIGRVNEVVRRFVDVAEPVVGLGYVDVGALIADLASLLGHDARRRRVELVVDAPRGSLRSAADPVRTGRLLLSLVGGAMAAAPDGGRLEIQAAAGDGRVAVRVAHAAAEDGPPPGYDLAVAAAAAEALGGALAVRREPGVTRLALTLPRIDRP